MDSFITRNANNALLLTSGYPLYIMMFIALYLFWIRKFGIKKQLIYAVFIVYIMLVIETTLFPIPLNSSQVQIFKADHNSILNLNFFPFIFDASVMDSAFLMHYIYLNVFMFIPFGILINIIRKQQSFVHTLLYSLLFSIMIESVQLIMQLSLYTDRITDINDIIANTLGGLMGYAIFAYVRVILKIRLQSEDKNIDIIGE